jgi:predicted phage terminase large subunit-like protein
VELTSDLIYGFTGSLLSKGFDEPAPTPECHREWWDLCTSKFRRVAIAAPRGHAKSTAITKSYTLASVLFRDRKYVIIVSDTYKQACMFLAEIKRELIANDDLRQLFGLKEILTDREDDVIVEMNDGHRFRVMAAGSEQKIRGILWEGKRPDLIIGDDMENDELVMNPDRREKFRNWFMNALIPVLSERGIVRLIGTILHLDSLLEGYMPKSFDPNTVLSENELKISMKHPTKDGWMGVKYLAHNEGEPLNAKAILWPVKWTKERLDEQYQMYAGRGNPEGYWQEYLNKPIDPKNAYFRDSDFTDFDIFDHTRTWTHSPTYLSCDLATSTKEKRDYCVFGIGSIDEQGRLYIRYVERERQDSKQVVDTIVNLYRTYHFNTILIGKGTLEKSIGPFLRDALHRQGFYIHIEAIPEVIDKRSRAQSIRARMRAEGVKFDTRKRWFPEFKAELLQFDRGIHDDQVDMMALFGMYLDQIIDAPTIKEIEDEEWEKEWNTTVVLDEGRSPTTGY